MAFTSLQFALFFLAVLSAAWLLRRWRTAHKVWLLTASYAFLGALDLRFVALLAASSAANWGLGEALARCGGPRARKAWLATGVAANVLFLGFFKYYDFFRHGTADAARLLGLTAHLPILEILLPVGISFYTFQAIAYLADLYRGTGVRADRLLDFLLFMGLFPKLVAGPICRSRDLLPQIQQGAPERVPDVSEAVGLVVSGLFKKVLLATYLSTRLVEDAFVAPENFSSLELLVAAYAYSVQVYCDFSGYTDLSRGTALLLGYRLPENFLAPYAATDIGDFWRRWHVTFSSWLREYIYYPLGGSRGSLLRTGFNLMVTFVVCGLWHGAHWTFILWGSIHGAALFVHKLIRDAQRALGRDPKRPPPAWWSVLGWVATFHVVTFARIPFRAPDLDTAVAYASRVFAFTLDGPGFDAKVLVLCAVGLLLNFVGRPVRGVFVRLHERVPLAARPAVWAALGVVILAVQPGDVAPFIYFRF